MGYPYPSLSSEGFITTIDRKCDRALINMFASDASQSNVFMGNVTSIQDILYRYSDKVTEAAAEIGRAVETVLSRYFDAAQIRGQVEDLPNEPGRVNIIISGTVVEGYRRYDFGRQVESVNGLVQRILNNQGAVIWNKVG